MNDNLKYIRTLFWIAFAVSIIAFFCPFFDKETGVDIYMDIFKEIAKNALTWKLAFVFLLLFCIIFWLPIMAYSFYRYTLQKRYYTIRQRLVNYFLFTMGFSVYALPVYAYYDGADVFNVFTWGYWLLLIFMSIMFACYIVVQKEQLIDNDDISEHLIDNDE